jgi:predicted nuclease of predicted toxin-antitoxin system
MRFLVDAQLSPRLAELLRGMGHEADHVATILNERAPDREIVGHAERTAAVLVSKDFDFVELIERRAAAPLLWIRTGNTSHRLLVERLEVQWDRIVAELQSGKLIVALN